MPPKIFEKSKSAESKKEGESTAEEQARRITDSDDDLSSEEERGIIIGAKEEVKSDEILVEASREEVMDFKENVPPLLFAAFKESLARNPQAKRFILNATKDAIHPSEEMQSNSKTRAENRIIKSELKRITPCHMDLEEKVFGKMDHPLTPEVLKTILYIREPLSFEEIISFPSTQLDALYRLETLVAENGLANSMEMFSPTSYSQGVEAEIEELNKKGDFKILQSIKMFFDHKKYYLQRKEALMRHWEKNKYAEILPDKEHSYRKMLASYKKIEAIGAQAEIKFQRYLEQLPANREVIDLRQKCLESHISALRAASDRERFIHEEYIIEEMEMMRRESYHPFRFITYQSAIIKTLKEAISPLKFNSLDLALGSTIGDLRNRYGQQQVDSIVTNTKLSKITKDLDEKKQLGRKTVAEVEHLAKTSYLGEKKLRDKTETVLSQLANIEALDLAIKPISAEQLMLEWAHLILTTAEKTKRTFNILKIVDGYKGPTAVSRTIAEYLGKLWVGPNYTINSNSWESQDGLKRYRFTSSKFQGLGSRADTGFQSNFDWRANQMVDWNLSSAELKRLNANWGGGHLDVLH